MSTGRDLSIVIVNYNTKDLLNNCLASIFNSKQRIKYKVWVVDNNSTDKSSEMVLSNFPDVRLIANKENLGFAKANNQVLRKIDSEFVLLLNPDTIVFDHVFDETIKFLKQNAHAGMVTCKLVKADGKLDLACRRSFPNAFDGFCRATGLSKLFPKSRLFARYNLTFLDENKSYEVDAINGAFMMAKKTAVDQVGLLDEDYFMYMEDLDWCFNFQKKDWRIYYVPSSKVIHLKGESSKQKSYAMIREFFRSMKMFCLKNYFQHQQGWQWWLIASGITTWEWMTLLQNRFRFEKRVRPL